MKFLSGVISDRLRAKFPAGDPVYKGGIRDIRKPTGQPVKSKHIKGVELGGRKKK